MPSKKTVTKKPQPVLTNERIDKLRTIEHKLRDIRHGLGNMRGEDNISDIMFKIGQTYSITSWLEDEIDEMIADIDNEMGNGMIDYNDDSPF